MKTITTIGLDIAKFVFQVHGIEARFRPICQVTQAAVPLKVSFISKKSAPGAITPKLN